MEEEAESGHNFFGDVSSPGEGGALRNDETQIKRGLRVNFSRLFLARSLLFGRYAVGSSPEDVSLHSLPVRDVFRGGR